MSAREASPGLEELRSRTRDLFALLRSARELGKDAAAVIEKAAREVEQRFARQERTILVLGESADRRALLDALLGESVFASVQREAKATVRLRSRAVLAYEAELRGGATERFEESVPAREDAFEKAIARSERERAAAEEEARAIAIEIETEQRGANTIVIEPRTYPERFHALWVWLVAWFYGLFSRAARPAALPEPPSLEARAREAAARIANARAHRARLEAERDLYAVERRASFFAAVRTLVDDLSRGGEVLVLTVDVFSRDLPAGITLVNAPALQSYEAVDGSLLVTDAAAAARERNAGALEALGALATRLVAPGAPLPEVRRALEEIQRAAPLALGEQAIALARKCIGAAVDDAARAEAVCRERTAAIERQRLTDPAEFRARSMVRIEKSIHEGARDVVAGAFALLSPRMEAVKAEWREAILACSDRKGVEACVQAIRDSAPARISAIVDAVNDFVVAEMQRTSDTAQLWLLEEIHARYQLARRASAGEGPAPVITEAESGELPALPALEGTSFADAMDAFEQGRVGYGLGGAAAGAVLGTLVAPVIGTAIGAFLGVFAGLLKGVDSLKQDCAAKIDACADESAVQIRAQLEAREESLAAALRASLEDALDAAMQRFARSIARLMELEAKTLATERDKLARLAALRSALAVHEAAFTALAERARGLLAQGAGVGIPQAP